MNAPSTTKAAILCAQRSDLLVDTIELPTNLEVGQVLVEVIRSGICGSQLGEIDGVKGEDKYIPHLMGHEGFGRVIEVGAGVKNVKATDHVILHWRPGAGIQSEPPKYRWDGKRLNAGWVTTFNKHAVVSENRCTKVEENLDPDIGALFGCAITTGFGVIENNAKVKMGESVVVFGAGGVGLNIVQSASLVSAWPIIAVDRFDNRLELARKLGATYCINTSTESFEAKIKEVMRNISIDVFIDNTGIPSIIEMGYKITHGKGRIVLVGVPRSENNVSLHTLPLHFGKTIIGSHGGEIKPNVDIPRYLRLHSQGKLKLNDLISKHYRLEDINTAIKDMRTGSIAGRAIITM